jgi:hypothetical protein
MTVRTLVCLSKYINYEEEAGRRSTAKMLIEDDARRIGGQRAETSGAVAKGFGAPSDAGRSGHGRLIRKRSRPTRSRPQEAKTGFSSMLA